MSGQPLRAKQQVAQQFSRAAASYSAAGDIQRQVREQLLTLLLSQQSPQGLWLDIGCGPGEMLQRLKDAGAQQVTGIDMAAGMLQQARRAEGIHLLQADADTLPLASDSVDGIFSSLMLQWSEQTGKTLREWARVLRPGGVLALATLLPGTQRELAEAWSQVDQHPHVNDFCSSSQLSGHLRRAGLRISTRRQECLAEYHPDLTTLLRVLKATGATNVNPGRAPGLGGRRALQALERVYPRAHGRLPLSYETEWLMAEKTV